MYDKYSLCTAVKYVQFFTSALKNQLQSQHIIFFQTDGIDKYTNKLQIMIRSFHQSILLFITRCSFAVKIFFKIHYPGILTLHPMPCLINAYP